MSKRKYIVLFIFINCLVVFSGCVKRTGSTGGTAGLYREKEETATEVTDTDARRGSTDIVVLTYIDFPASQLTVKSIGDGRLYTLNYNGGTSIQNRFGTEILMQDMELGEVAEVSFTAGSQKLLSIKESETAWENTTVKKWSIDYDKKIMTIGSDKFIYDDNLVILSNGRQIDIHQLNSVDSLVVKGMDKKICSINVKVGHGYIRVTDETNLLGGLIEVGTNIMTVISEDMMIVAPEGTYTLTASKNGVGGSTEIVVNRDDETTVSLSGFQGEVERQGNVKFNIRPEDTQYNVFIDSRSVDAAEVIPLSYGVHKLVITSDKYTDYTEDIVVSSIYMNKTIDLAASKSEEETTGSEEETTVAGASGEKETTTAKTSNTFGETSISSATREDGLETMTAETDNNYIVVSGPVGAEIYMDGIYKGKAPVTFQKSSGSHIFVRRAEGYTTTAYSYTFDTSTRDVYIKFPELEESDS